MIGVLVAAILGCIAIAVVGYLHGENMYALGRRRGRQEEAMKARHARERIVEQAERIAIGAYIDAREAH